MFIVNWQRYFELEKKKKEDMTEDEKEFFNWMYHVEECLAGLDGEVYE